jgi:hypothetical protein
MCPEPSQAACVLNHCLDKCVLNQAKAHVIRDFTESEGGRETGKEGGKQGRVEERGREGTKEGGRKRGREGGREGGRGLTVVIGSGGQRAWIEVAVVVDEVRVGHQQLPCALNSAIR